ncbi:MAG: hypothetical protein RI955_131 [Bacteroidota bacterium]
MIVGSWKEVGCTSLRTNQFRLTNNGKHSTIFTFFKNFNYQEFQKTEGFFGDSLNQIYSVYSINTVESPTKWLVKTSKLFIEKYPPDKIIYLSKDTLILERNYKREGGKFLIYFKKEKQQLKYFSSEDIVLINEKSQNYKAFQSWKQKFDSIRNAQLEYLIKHPSFRNDTTFYKKYLPPRIEQISYNKIITQKDIGSDEYEDSIKSYEYHNNSISRFEFQIKDECFDNENDNVKFKLTQNFQNKKLINSEYHEYALRNVDSHKVLIDKYVLKNEFGETERIMVMNGGKVEVDSIFSYAASTSGKRFCSFIDINEYSNHQTSKGKFSSTKLKLSSDGDVEIKMLLNFKHKVVQTTLYYKNGVKLNEPEIIHGDGKYTFCNPDGQVCCECEIKNGKIKNCHPIK